MLDQHSEITDLQDKFAFDLQGDAGGYYGQESGQRSAALSILAQRYAADVILDTSNVITFRYSHQQLTMAVKNFLPVGVSVANLEIPDYSQ